MARKSFVTTIKNSHGFTLIEVLIAMTLLSLMVTLLFSSLAIGSKSWEQGDKKITEVNQIAIVQQFFNQHLALATPQWNDFDAEKDRVFSFQGKKEVLQFVSSFPVSAERSGLQLFNIELKKKNLQQIIEVRVTPFFPVAKETEWFNDSVELISDVDHLEFAYFGINDETGEYSWQSEWINKEQQPRLVKILLTLNDERYLPEIIVPLMVDTRYSNADLESVPTEETMDTTK